MSEKKPIYIYSCIYCGFVEKVLAQDYNRKKVCSNCAKVVYVCYDNGNGKKRILPEFIKK